MQINIFTCHYASVLYLVNVDTLYGIIVILIYKYDDDIHMLLTYTNISRLYIATFEIFVM